MQDANLVYGILSIVGGFGIIALSVNAFFLKGIYDRLGTVEIAQASIFAREEAKEKRIERLEQNENILFERINKLENQL